MKLIIIPLLLILSFKAFAQPDSITCPSKIDTLTSKEVYTAVDVAPTPEGGMANLYSQVLKNLKIINLSTNSRIKIHCKVKLGLLLNL